MDFTLIHVLRSFGSNTNCSVAFFVDSSTMLKYLRTGMYRHSLSFPASVLAPQIIAGPLPSNVRITLIDFPATTSTLSDSCCLFVINNSGLTTSFILTFAGAFQTPLESSTNAYTPTTAEVAGINICVESSALMAWKYPALFTLLVSASVAPNVSAD